METTIALPMLKKRHASRHAAPASGRRFDATAAFGWGGLTLAGVIGAISSGFSGAAMMLGFFALVVGVIALARGRVGWAGLRSRTTGGVVLGASMIIITVGALAPPPTASAPPTSASVTAVTPTSTTTSVAGPVAKTAPTLEAVATATAQGPSSPPTAAAPPVVQPAPAPATVAPGNGATALCNDGTLSYKAHNRGTCASHGGVKVFYK